MRQSNDAEEENFDSFAQSGCRCHPRMVASGKPWVITAPDGEHG